MLKLKSKGKKLINTDKVLKKQKKFLSHMKYNYMSIQVLQIQIQPTLKWICSIQKQQIVQQVFNFEFINHLQKQIQNEIIIPPIIKRLHSNIPLQKYKELLKHPLFMQNNAYVCEDCYLLIVQTSKMAGDYIHWNRPTKENIKGIGLQKPKDTRYRQNETMEKIRLNKQPSYLFKDFASSTFSQAMFSKAQKTKIYRSTSQTANYKNLDRSNKMYSTAKAKKHIGMLRTEQTFDSTSKKLSEVITPPSQKFRNTFTQFPAENPKENFNNDQYRKTFNDQPIFEMTKNRKKFKKSKFKFKAFKSSSKPFNTKYSAFTQTNCNFNKTQTLCKKRLKFSRQKQLRKQKRLLTTLTNKNRQLREKRLPKPIKLEYRGEKGLRQSLYLNSAHNTIKNWPYAGTMTLRTTVQKNLRISPYLQQPKPYIQPYKNKFKEYKSLTASISQESNDALKIFKNEKQFRTQSQSTMYIDTIKSQPQNSIKLQNLKKQYEKLYSQSYDTQQQYKNQKFSEFFSSCIPKNTLLRNKYEIKQIFGSDYEQSLEKELKRKRKKYRSKKRQGYLSKDNY